MIQENLPLFLWGASLWEALFRVSQIALGEDERHDFVAAGAEHPDPLCRSHRHHPHFHDGALDPRSI